MLLYQPGCRAFRLAETARQAAHRVLAGMAGSAILDRQTADHRDYAPGDDYRAVDWYVCARHDELRVRQTTGEIDSRFSILLDCSRSMALGSPAKFAVARESAMAIAALVAGEGVEVAAAGLGERAAAVAPPVRRSPPAGLARFLEGLAAEESGIDFERVARQWVRGRRPGPAVLLSDCLEWDNIRQGLMALAEHGHRPWLIHLIDRGEAEPALLGDVELVDIETGSAWEATIREKHVARYRQLFDNLRRQVTVDCRRLGILHRAVMTDGALDEALWRRLGIDFARLIGRQGARR